MQWFIDCVTKKYADFSGRARRTEYWMFFLFNVIISVILGVVEQAIGIVGPSALVGLALLIPGIAVGVRRLHDIGKSGWWLLVAFAPCIGALILIYFFVQDSQPGSNEYGANPKGG
jgi:uncharacterized membrane protein YhaH (DUF805 family)